MLKRLIAFLVVFLGALIAWFVISPVPGALVIRFLFQLDAAKTKEAMESHASPAVQRVSAIRYSPDSEDALLDVYRRDGAEGRQATVVWVHGGAWLSGHRDDAAPYFTLLADAGYTVVSVGYSRAPGARYPRPVRQVGQALAYLRQHANELGVDPGRIALAGDSAGAQIASQVAAMATNPDYAAEVGIAPGVAAADLRAIVLYCGIYDMRRFLDVGDLPSLPLRWGVREVVRAYTGSREPDTVAARQMSSIDHVSPSFPPSFISGGNGDSLTEAQSRPLAEKLRGEGVEVETLFFPADLRPELPHEYQFNLDTEQGQEALRRTLAFLRRHLTKAG